jgi:hypothetical protein
VKRVTVVILLAVVCLPALMFAVGSRDALYVGGTVAGLSEKSEGRFDMTDEDVLRFMPRETGGPVAIQYAKITELEYGQKAGRRVAVAVLISPLALFSKKRNHYLTISYTDEKGKDQAAVFELGKDIVRTTLKVIETRSGKDIQFQDDDARKSIGGGKGAGK